MISKWHYQRICQGGVLIACVIGFDIGDEKMLRFESSLGKAACHPDAGLHTYSPRHYL